VAAQYHAPVYPIEMVCSDPAELAQRLNARPGNWQQLAARMSRSYKPAPEALVLDSRHTASTMADQAIKFVYRHNC
jgi:hypothetical protein